MSAYIVDDVTINRIVSGLNYAAHYGGWNSPLPKPSEELAFDDAAIMGHVLRKMNEESVYQRYPDDNPDELPGPVDENGKNPPYKYDPIVPPSPIQLFKSLQCYLYQCDEGDTDKCKLYQALDQYLNEIAYHVMTNSKEYEAAAWA
jgi:hypothetical protein